MEKKYLQLSLRDREKIAILKAEGKTIRTIGKEIGRYHTTILRELRRNSNSLDYSPSQAELKAMQRKKEGGHRDRLKTKEIKQYVEEKIKIHWSPEQIAGRLKIEKPNLSISHEAIYQYIYIESPQWIPYLTRRKKQRFRRSNIKFKNRLNLHKVSIEERPKDIEERVEGGHWEADMAISSANKVSVNILCERKSRYVQISRLENKTAYFTRYAILKRLTSLPASMRRTITYDNGPENADHQYVNRLLGTQSYFCHPYHSWEKGTVENTIGLIRRFFPKKIDFDKVPKKDIKRVEELLNTRPRKCLKFKTPKEVFNDLRGALTG